MITARLGTRSTSGQLSSFKKGTFYMWLVKHEISIITIMVKFQILYRETLKSPIIPFISFGGYDLFPVSIRLIKSFTHPFIHSFIRIYLLSVWWKVGKWLNTPGKVVIQYLPIIQPNEAATRDAVRNVFP